jgi:hypothetical protein
MGVSIVVGSRVKGGLGDEPIEALLDSEEAGSGHLVSSECDELGSPPC